MSELGGIDMPRIEPAAVPGVEAAALSRLQAHLDDIGRYARTFTAAAEMLSFAQQRAGAHEARFAGDGSALAKERRNLLSEWQDMAVRDGAMTLFHFAGAMDGVTASLAGCPTLSGSIDQARLSAAARRFRVAFPGFRAIGPEAGPPASATPTMVSFSQDHASGHIALHGAKGNVFRFGQAVKFMAAVPGGDEQASYALDSRAVYELRGIASIYAETFNAAAARLTPG